MTRNLTLSNIEIRPGRFVPLESAVPITVRIGGF